MATPTLSLIITLLATPAMPSPGLRDSLADFVAVTWDSTASGFFWKQGVPHVAAAEVGFALGRDGAEEWGTRALETTQRTLELEDRVGGGFFTEHQEDLAPGAGIFLKTTANQALRIEMMLDAFGASGDSLYLKAASRTVRFLERTALDARGGFAIGPAAATDLLGDANGVAIHAWLTWYAATRDVKRRDFALRSLDRVWNVTWRDSLGFVRVDPFGDILEWPNLADQVEMGRAYALAAHLIGRPRDLERARWVGDHLLLHFANPKGGFQNVAQMTKSGRVKKSSVSRDANARAVRFMAELSWVTGDARYRESAVSACLTVLEKKRKKPSAEDAEWVMALRALEQSPLPAPPAVERAKLGSNSR